jgi:hypothetical protein
VSVKLRPPPQRTLLLSTMAVEQTIPLIWVTVDAGDHDPVRLCTHVAAASRAHRGLGSRAIEHLSVPFVPDHVPVPGEALAGVAGHVEDPGEL